jgi:hypothetical protein
MATDDPLEETGLGGCDVMHGYQYHERAQLTDADTLRLRKRLSKP